MDGNSQIVLIDTPGIFKPKRRLDRAMVSAAWSSVSDADETVLIVDARDMSAASGKKVPSDQPSALPSKIAPIVTDLRAAGRTAILVLNKIDVVPKSQLLEIVDQFQEESIFSAVFLISALNGDGVEDLKSHLSATVPEGPWLFPEDQAADLPLRSLAAEITREKLILRLHQELPYMSTVETETWTEKKDGSVKIDQIIYVTREAHKPIVLGKKGQTLKEIGKAAREEMMEVFDRRVHLFLFVKVRSKWVDDPQRYRAMGLDFPID